MSRRSSELSDRQPYDSNTVSEPSLAGDTLAHALGNRVGLEAGLIALLDESSHASNRVIENSFRSMGVSMMQAGVLLVITTARQPVTPADLSRWLFREPHTIFALLKQMEKRGLIRKVKDLQRKNMVRIEMTDEGKKIIHKTGPTLKVINEITSCLSEAERAELASYLGRIRTQAVSMLQGKDALRMWPQSPFFEEKS